jgi:hypothetical protein
VTDSAGRVYVSDIANNVVQQFTETGMFLEKWGEFGQGDAQFFQPSGLAIDSLNQNLFVADSGNARIQVFGLESTTPTPIQSRLQVQSVDLQGNAIEGMRAVIRAENGTEVHSGFTPLTFDGHTGSTYRVTVSNYDGRIFDHWVDDASNNNRTRPLSLAANTTIVAAYDPGDSIRGFSSLRYDGTEAQPDLTVNAIALDNIQPLRMWMIIDPQSFNSSAGTGTYKVYATNGYLQSLKGDPTRMEDFAFSHWSDDGSINRIRTLTIGEATMVTAVYVRIVP